VAVKSAAIHVSSQEILMKLFNIAAFSAVVLAAGMAVADEEPKAKNKYKSEKEQMSYALGFDIGRTFKDRGVELDPELLIKAFKAGYAKKDSEMTREELENAFMSYQKAARAEAQRISEAKAKASKEEGEAFLKKNAKRKGVITDKSGLQYEILKKSKGESPKKDSIVKAHYHGTFIDGGVFDSSLDKRPLIIPVNGVIEGWSIALQKMKVGEKWKLFIPTDLAYGANPDPRSPIPPNAALIFEVELLGIEKDAKPGDDEDAPADGESAPDDLGSDKQ